MDRIILKNDFHNTSCRLKSHGTLTARQVQIARTMLCGIQGCTCGGNAGERGTQTLDDGQRVVLVPNGDGSICIEMA